MSHESPPVANIVEAMLFLGGRPITSELIALVLPDVHDRQLSTIVKELNERYARQNRPYRINREVDGWWLRLDPTVAAWLRERVRPERGIKLGRQHIAVLSLIAYRQPISRAEIESRTHFDSSSALQRLLRLRLIVQGVLPSGEPVFSTTSRFLEVFQMDSLELLPQLEDLMNPGHTT